MPKSSYAELAALRQQVFDRDGGCVWPGCDKARTGMYDRPFQLAHLTHRGMGGSKERNTADNCVVLCGFHHDIFDGRDGTSNTKRELALMLRTVAGL